MNDLAACPPWPGIAHSIAITRWCWSCATESTENECFVCNRPTSNQPPPLWDHHGATEQNARSTEHARMQGY